MNRFKLLGVIAAFAAAVGVCPRVANASSTFDKISNIQVTGTSFVRLGMTNAINQALRPACHSSSAPNDYAFDVSTNKGRALLSVAQAALLAGKNVNVFGGSTCTTIGSTNIETVQTLVIFN